MGFDQFLLTKLKENNARFTAVDSPNCVLTQEDIQELADALKNNTSVKSLSLPGNGITDEAFEPLAKVLENHPSIEALNLTKNKLTNRSAALIASIIAKNTTLVKLEIRLNPGIDAEGAKLIETALCHNQVLKMVFFELLSESSKELIKRNIKQYYLSEKLQELIDNFSRKEPNKELLDDLIHALEEIKNSSLGREPVSIDDSRRALVY